MIENLTIQNFRCFQETEIRNFARVNLIGGKNNSGKTSLLEALLVYAIPQPSSIIELKKVRQESSDIDEEMPDRAWDSFFFDQHYSHSIRIFGDGDIGESKQVILQKYDSINTGIADILEDHQDAQKLLELISKNHSNVSVLQIRVKNNEREINKSAVVASSSGLLALAFKDHSHEGCLIPAFIKISNEELAKKYDKAIFDEEAQAHEVIEIFRILDPDIEKIETFSIVEPTLYLKRKNEKRLPISLFGDAINRVAAITLNLIDGNKKILLIDEIENGIHYTNQKNFWKTLFRLSRELDTQIFATTHSLEMIKAFAEAGQEDSHNNNGAYFELARNPRNNKIVAIKRDFDVLEYDIQHHQPFRGE